MCSDQVSAYVVFLAVIVMGALPIKQTGAMEGEGEAVVMVMVILDLCKSFQRNHHSQRM